MAGEIWESAGVDLRPGMQQNSQIRFFGGKRNLKRKEKKEKNFLSLGKGNKAYEGVWCLAKSKRIFH